MGEELSLDNILGAEEIDNLFVEEESSVEETNENNEIKNNETTEVTNVDTNTLFTEEPESVGSEETDKHGKEDTTSKEVEGTSPIFYSSIAKALKEDGILPDLNDEDVNSIKQAEDFASMIDKQIKLKFDERYKRIDDALNANVEPSEINKFENTIKYLDSIQETDINDESEKGEILRKKLIFQDFINRGYTEKRAQREVQKSFDSGSDIEDAKEALESNKDYFNSEYDNLIKEAKEKEEKDIKERNNRAEELKKAILEDDKVFGELSIDKSTRQKAYDNISKPIYRNPDTGEYLTAVQKYEKENKVKFMKAVGLIYTLTNGFENMEGLVKNKVKKEMKKGIRELENTLNNTSRTSNGNLNFANTDSESIFKDGIHLDL